MAVFAEIGYEIYGMGAYLTDESGNVLTDEGGNGLTLDQPGFVDVTPDVLFASPPEFEWGIAGHDPLSRVATGSGRLRLNNSHANNRHTQGWYTIGHPDAWPGYGRDSLVRMRVEYGSTRRYYGLGEITHITPEAGKYGGRFVDIAVEGIMKWYGDAGDVDIRPLARNLTAGQLYQRLTSGLKRRPPNQTFSGGKLLAYGFDMATRTRATPSNEMNKIAQSTLDYILVRSDSTWGATVFRQGFNERLMSEDVVFSLSHIRELSADWDSGMAVERVIGSYYPRRVGTEMETLWSVDKPIQVRPGETITIKAQYRDASGGRVRIAGQDIRTTPVAADFRFGLADDGLSDDLHDSLQFSIVPGATAANVNLTNTHSVKTGYVNVYDLKGRAIRFYEAGVVQAPAGALEGSRDLNIDMAYEDDNLRAKDIVEILYEFLKLGQLQLHWVKFLASHNSDHMQAALLVEPGQRIHVSEEMTVDGDFFVNGKALRQIGKGLLECTFYLEAAPPWSDYWLCGVSGRSECGVSTRTRGV